MSAFSSMKCFILVTLFTFGLGVRYHPSWKSLDTRPLPQWYDQAKIGIFVHWGVFSVPSFGSEWFWFHWQGVPDQKYVQFMNKNYRPGFTYADFARDFTAEFYSPDAWADLFKKSGAKYVVLTSKHHEGYTMWPSKGSFSWNAKDVGPGKDLVDMLMKSVRNRTDLHFGLYHSLYEWFNPVYLNDIVANRSDFVNTKTMPELYDLVNKYKPEVIWSDGDWDMSADYWKSKEFLAWLYNDSPVSDRVVTNDRWGRGVMCKHGDFFTCSDHYNPGVLQKHKWENCFSIDRGSWGFRRDAHLSDLFTIEEIIGEIARTVSCGGNVLINVGPTSDGRITPVFEERLTQMGEWLAVNGPAIYSSKPWRHQNDTTNANVWYTSSSHGHVFAITLRWPDNERLVLGAAPKSMTNCKLLGFGPVKCDSGLVRFPSKSRVQSQWAWVVQFNDDDALNSIDGLAYV